ncbi:MAG: hypothetical protein VKL39_22400 [Leptolyngbyaceae bacterium]|nr:hypothetical protein [Leptolyngbyaceae bacterium]
MTTTIASPQSHIVLQNVSWATYEALIHDLDSGISGVGATADQLKVAMRMAHPSI